MVTLEDKLKAFRGSGGQMENLTVEFADLAKHFLYGGYFEVGRFKIFLRDIEFYYHDEQENMKGRVTDDIMYHRNGKDKHNPYPQYFEFGSMHEHMSGIDLCFENEKLQFRASILMRAVEVHDGDKVIIEKRPTYVPSFFLMYQSVFNSGYQIKWVDTPIEPNYVLPKPIERKNAGRLWRYSII